MIVCLCRGVNDQQIRRAISHGAGCLDSIGRACGAGTACGSCRDEIALMLQESALRTRAASTRRRATSEAA